MKNIIKISLIALTAIFATQSFAKENDNTKKYKCEIEFDLGKFDIKDKKSLLNCFKKVPQNEVVKLIHVISSANQIGNVKNNEILAAKRLKSARDFIDNQEEERFKTAITEELSMGRNNVLGKKVHILILTSIPQDPLTITIEKPVEKIVEKVIEKEIIIREQVPVIETKKEISDYQFFVGTRVGRDIFMNDQIVAYTTYGLLTGVQYQTQQPIKYELGLAYNQMTNDKVYSLNTLHSFAGAYYITEKHAGFFIGLRGLAGTIFNQNGQFDFDGGGEGRLGYENQLFSVSFAAGRTNYTTRVGLELAVKF